MIKNAFLLLLCCYPVLACAQQQPADTAAAPPPKGLFKKMIYYLKHTNDVKKKKKFDFSIIGGPYSAPETNVGIAIMGAAQYKTDYHDPNLAISNANVYISGSLSGFYGVGLNDNTIFRHDRYRLNAQAAFNYMPDRYWGIGYDAGNLKNNYTKYTLVTDNIAVDFGRRILSGLYAGISVLANNSRASKIDSSAGKPIMPTLHEFDFGIGPFVVYDTRDFIPNPYKGIYARLGYQIFPAFLGSTSVFSTWTLQLDAYQPLWKGAIWANDLYGATSGGDVPWTLLPEAGGANRLRGYYQGRFRDKNFIALQTELRQRIYRRNGLVVWVGAGNVFPSFPAFTLNQTLISYGIGYRWEFKKRVNIRLDYGLAKDQSGFYFGINEAF
ncbi:BamA/TamA family outer membrane protein [Chitinophaga sp. 30R24]|uniref:BamA/TamA family outer membrane protein n=1 Tax=Chitinophaga sp. 30R24 TaxID=3248838 RepID=UPI003B90BB2B